MKLIDKDALVAEIESKIKKYTKRGEESDAKRDGYGMYWGGVLSCLNEVKTLIDTVEVKEVDLEKEIEEHAIDMPMSEFTHESEVEDFLEWARKEFRYFFELGLNASNPLTWEDVRLLDILCCGVDVHCDLEEKEHYEEILKRFKAQKGEKV